MNKVRKENERLIENLKNITELNEKFRPKPVDKYSFLLNKEDTKESKEHEHIARLIPGVSLDKATDLEYLSSILMHVEAKIVELTEAQSRKYGNKQLKYDLQNQFFEKITIRDNVIQERNNIRNRLFLYKLAMHTAKDYYHNKSSNFTSIYDALTKTLAKNYLSRQSTILNLLYICKCVKKMLNSIFPKIEFIGSFRC